MQLPPFMTRIGTTTVAALALALATSVDISAAAPHAFASDSFRQKITCTKADVRSQPYGKGKHVMNAFQQHKAWGTFTKQATYKSGPFKGTTAYWFGTWHDKKRVHTSWIKLACADPRLTS